MATTLLQIIDFVGVAASGSSSLPHNINVNGIPKVPDVVLPSAAGFTITVTQTTVTVTNNNSAPASIRVYLQLNHSIPRVFRAGTAGTPFVASGGGTSGGGTVATNPAQISGDGVTPLGTVAGGTAIAADGTSIGGTGVTGDEIHTISGGVAVVTDQETAFGNGTTGDPIRTNIPALANIANNGAATWQSMTGFTGSHPTHNSTGSVSMSLVTVPPGISGHFQIIPIVSLQSGSGRISVSVDGAGLITVLTFNTAGAATDLDFFIHVGIADPF